MKPAWTALRSLRWQIAIGQALVVCAVLAVFAALLVWGAQRTLFAELDRHLHRDAEAAQQALSWDGTQLRWRELVHSEGDPFDTEPFVEVWSADGRLLMERVPRGLSQPWRLPRGVGELGAAGETAYSSVQVASGARQVALRVGVERYVLPGLPGPLLLRVARSEAPLRAELAALARGVVLSAVAVALLATALSAWLAGRALDPLQNLVARMQRIGRTPRLEPGARAGMRGAPQEVSALAAEFDAMLERLAQSHADIDRFAADCAHELRTPLTALRLRGEQHCQTLPEGPARQAVGDMLEAADRMTLRINRLLVLARAGHLNEQHRLVVQDLAPLAAQATETMRPLAEAAGVELTVQAETAHAAVDALWLQQALQDLLHNAIRHAGPGLIEVGVHALRAPQGAAGAAGVGRGAQIVIADRGPGVPALVLDELKLPRWPAAPTASAATGAPQAAQVASTRLGLRIVQRLLAAQGGSFELAPRPGGGTLARLRFVALPLPTQEVSMR